MTPIDVKLESMTNYSSHINRILKKFEKFDWCFNGVFFGEAIVAFV